MILVYITVSNKYTYMRERRRKKPLISEKLKYQNFVTVQWWIK